MNKNLSDDKKKALAAALGQIEKQFGKGSIMKMDATVQKIPAISTGSIKIDNAIGIGGIPKGRIVEIYGPESSGKTTLTLQIVAECQKAGGVAAFIDAEHALDPVYAQKLGVIMEDLILSQPDTGEQALEIVDMLARSGAVDLIIVDSVAALVPKAEIEGEMGDSHMGLQARLMSQALRKITGNLKQTNTTVVFINQLRMKIGVMFGNPETTTGGNALKFYASVRIDIRGGASGAIKDGDNVIGKKTKVKIVKNKVSPPFKEAEVDLMFGYGVDKTGEVLDFAVEQSLVLKTGAWYSLNNEKIGQGRINSKKWLEENPAILAELETKVRANLETKNSGENANYKPVKEEKEEYNDDEEQGE